MPGCGDVDSLMVGTGLSSGRLALGCNIHTSGPGLGWQGAIVVSLWMVAHFSTYRRDFPLTLDLGTPSHAVKSYLAWGLSNIHTYGDGDAKIVSVSVSRFSICDFQSKLPG